jgi:hypothetical protein
VGKPERKRLLVRPKRRWVGNMKMCLKTEYGGINWIDLAQDTDPRRAFANMVLNLHVP